MDNFANLVFNIWGWLFPFIRWFVDLLTSPAPSFLLDFVHDFNVIINYVSTVVSAVSAVPMVSLFASVANGVLSMIQAYFLLMETILGTVPFGVVLIGLMIGFGVISAILDWLHKCVEALKEFVLILLDLFL